MPIQVGAPAPDFTLYDTGKQKISLRDFRGKNVVLMFFPLAFSGTCTKEMCEMRDNYSFYEGMNAEVIAISVDSLYTNGKFKELNKLNFPLLSDFNKQVSKEYNSLSDHFSFEYQGVTRRSTFVIDKDGNLVYEEILPLPGDYPNMEKLKEVVASLK